MSRIRDNRPIRLKLKHNDLKVEFVEVKKQYCKASDDNNRLNITVSSLSKHEDSLKLHWAAILQVLLYFLKVYLT